MNNTVLAVISRQMGIQREMDVIANNIANTDTGAFKSERILFVEYLQDVGNSQTISFMKSTKVIRDYSDGPLQMTGNSLDVAVHGAGFFRVETPDGILYTRSGRLHLDAAGLLTNAAGMPLLSDTNLPILTFPGDTSITIDPSGRVSSESGDLGRLALVSFENVNKLQKLDNGLYRSKETPTPALEATIVQGALEGSNVEPVIEMTRMIRLLRSYQGSQTLGNEDHNLRRKAISILGRVSQTA